MGTDFESHSEFAISDDLWYCSLWFIGSLREVEPHLLKITFLCSIALIVTIDTLFAPTLFLMVSLRLEDVFALFSTFWLDENFSLPCENSVKGESTTNLSSIQMKILSDIAWNLNLIPIPKLNSTTLNRIGLTFGNTPPSVEEKYCWLRHLANTLGNFSRCFTCS